MRHSIRYALLAGAVLAAGAGVAFAQMEPPPPAPDMYGPGPAQGRQADRALRDFDLNHDGKITKAEVDKVEAQRFSEATAGAPAMTVAQFVKAHEKMLHQHTDKMFHRIDWNGDGVLSLDEFRAPVRARFAMMDHEGTGMVSCKPGDRRGTGRPGMKGPGGWGMHGMHGPGGHFAGGAMKMCQEADLNKDGKVTRAEADKAIAAKYAAVVKGGSAMTPDQFYATTLKRFEDMEVRRFKRLDANNDGKLGLAEFAAPGLKLFARLDRNKDGVLTRDELSSPPHRGPHGGWGKKPG